MADDTPDPNLSPKDRAIVGLLSLGWIPALLGGGDLIVSGQRWHSWTLTIGGVSAYVASQLWPLWSRKDLANPTHDLRNAPPSPVAPDVSDMDIPFGVAAQLAYEQAEEEGWVDNVVGGQNPQQRLDFFKQAILIQAQNQAVTLYGLQPPSTVSRPIPPQKIPGLHPAGEDSLRYLSAIEISYDDVSITSGDLDTVIAIYRALATGHDPG